MRTSKRFARILTFFCKNVKVLTLGLCLILAVFSGRAYAYETEPLFGPGYLHADRAYALFAKGSYAQAEQEAWLALNYYPQHPRLLLLVAQAREARGQYAEALPLLEKLSQEHPGFAQVKAIQGYVHAKMANHAVAVTFFEKTLTLNDAENVDRNALRINLIDSALRSNQPKIAAAHLASADPVVLRLQVVRALVEQLASQDALTVIDNTSIEGLPDVTVGEVWALKASILYSLGRNEEALQLYSKILHQVGDRSPYLKSEALWKIAEAAEQKGNVEEALKLGAESVAAYPESTVRRLQYAYMAIRNRRDHVATIHMEYAVQHATEGPPVAVFRDLAYSFKRSGNNYKAMYYFKRSIDLAPRWDKELPEQQQKAIQLNYDLRREHETLERKWGMYTALTYWTPARGDAVLQGSQEFYWQPYHKNGQKLMVFNRYYGNLWSAAAGTAGPVESTPWIASYGWSTAQGGIGLNWKPISDANLVLTVEKLFPVGQQGLNDWLYRIGYSWDQGVELKPIAKNWTYLTFYGEYVQWASSARQILGMETRWGRSHSLKGAGSRSVLTPHIFFTANYDSGYDGNNDQTRLALAVGPGIVLRKWYREDRYNAPKSFWDLTLQYRFNLGQRRIDGLLFQWFNSF